MYSPGWFNSPKVPPFPSSRHRHTRRETEKGTRSQPASRQASRVEAGLQTTKETTSRALSEGATGSLHVKPDSHLCDLIGVADVSHPPRPSLCLVPADQDEHVHRVGQAREPAQGDLGYADLVDAVHEVSSHLGRADGLAPRVVERGELAVHPEGQRGDPTRDGEGREGRQDQKGRLGS